MQRPFVMLLALAVFVSSCAADTGSASSTPLPTVPDASCAGAFVAHDLAHITAGPTRTTTMFDGTGSGIAAADLDGDGRQDLVLTNLAGETSVFWNDGQFDFTRQAVTEGRFRQPAAVDVDGDGRTDIVLTTGVGTPVLLTNRGPAEPSTGPNRIEFSQSLLPGVDGVAYSMAWGDLGGDGDLDLVTGSYNAELTQNRAFSPLLGGRSGVFVYEADGGAFTKELLTKDAQALAVRLQDLDTDGVVDIIVGNDLATPDAVWLAGPVWTPVDIFPETTFSTMSLDGGDFDNDGDIDLFATDMHPMTDDPEVLASWEPIFEDMAAQPAAPGNQKMENVLLAAEAPGEFTNRAPSLGLTASGWSWSGLFGDLDNDTFLDLYIVNGMAADSLFPDLPDNALVEPNQAYRNLGDGRMAPAPEWRLADEAGGRGLVMVDLDGDGDLDLAVNNLDAPARVYENRLCAGNGLVVELEWQGRQNHAGYGATVTATIPDGTVLTRTVDATRGYLSSGPPQVHFGLGAATSAVLSVTWPDGSRTAAEAQVGAGPVRVVSSP